MKDASNSIKKKKRIGMYVVLLFDFNEKVFLKKFFFFVAKRTWQHTLRNMSMLNI